jgi:hypothetical protein
MVLELLSVLIDGFRQRPLMRPPPRGCNAYGSYIDACRQAD